MTTRHIMLFLASCGLSACITYAWWTVVRVIRLRQDLFEIRDELFDDVAGIGQLCHPAYKHARDQFNGILHLAEMLCIPTTLFLFITRDRTPQPLSAADNPELQGAIDRQMPRLPE